jgi:CHAD domain-containing protein
MTAQLQPGETPRKGLRRIVRGQIDKALDDLGIADPVERVHSVRKRLKRLRALLRLARDGMDRSTFERETSRLRDAARSLASARDGAVLVATLDDLAELAGDLALIAETRDRLLQRQSDATRAALGDGSAFAALASCLRECRAAFDGDALRGMTWRVLRAGLRRIDRRGRRAFREAYESPSVENLHAFRKRVKELGYALEVVAPIRLDVIGRRAHLAGDLAESLGDDHDLAVLRQSLLAGAGPAPAVVALVPVIDARRASLQESAFTLGRKVYRERPRDFAGRLDRAWRSRAGA